MTLHGCQGMVMALPCPFMGLHGTTMDCQDRAMEMQRHRLGMATDGHWYRMALLSCHHRGTVMDFHGTAIDVILPPWHYPAGLS